MRLVSHFTIFTLTFLSATNVYGRIHSREYDDPSSLRREFLGDLERRYDIISKFTTRDLVEELEQRLNRRTEPSTSTVHPPPHAGGAVGPQGGTSPPVSDKEVQDIIKSGAVPFCMNAKDSKADGVNFGKICGKTKVKVVIPGEQDTSPAGGVQGGSGSAQAGQIPLKVDAKGGKGPAVAQGGGGTPKSPTANSPHVAAPDPIKKP